MTMSLTDYGASQIISVTFYQFLTKEVFCQEVTFLSCHHAKIDPNLSTNKKFGLIFVSWYDEKNEGSDLSNFSGFFFGASNNIYYCVTSEKIAAPSF